MALDIVSPADCELLIGIPLSAEEFLADLRRPEQEYATIFREGFPGAQIEFVADEYNRAVGKPVCEVLAQVAEWGVGVEKNANIKAVASAFMRARVVGLLAHSPAPPSDALVADGDVAEQSGWRCIELRDGSATIGRLADVIPNGWNGIVDFIACESSAHAHALKRRHPAATFIVNRRHASPIFRLRRFCASIAMLRQQPQPYADAVVAVLKMATA